MSNSPYFKAHITFSLVDSLQYAEEDAPEFADEAEEQAFCREYFKEEISNVQSLIGVTDVKIHYLTLEVWVDVNEQAVKQIIEEGFCNDVSEFDMDIWNSYFIDALLTEGGIWKADEENMDVKYL